MTRHGHRAEAGGGRRAELVLGLVAGTVCLVALFSLLRLIIAVDDARAYSASAATPGEMTVTYAGLEAPLARSHPGMPAPSRMCIVALNGGTARYAARLDGRACAGLRTGRPASVLTWRGPVIAVDGWATGDQPQGEVVAWAVATAAIGLVAVILTLLAVRASGNRRPSWYYERLKV
jgi:hypothetical protein